MFNNIPLVELICGRWWSSENVVAVVTGSNRGIGLEIARQLASHGLTLVLTARNVDAGLEAVTSLSLQQRLKVDFHHLDFTDSSSIKYFGFLIKQTFRRLYILLRSFM